MAATPADAQVILELYNLRRETELRKARDWFAIQFNPQSVDDIMSTLMAFGSDGNRYFRMVTSYWEMAATMANHGAVNEQLFLDTQAEMFFIFAKIHPYLDAFREKMGATDAMKNVETLINKSEASRKKLEVFKQRIERIRTMAAASQKN
jgi:L-rhamnose mutarotase